MIRSRGDEDGAWHVGGKVAWVTGATGGVGPAVVKALADAEATVLASAREAEVAALAAEHGIPASGLALPVDLTDDAAVQATVARRGLIRQARHLSGRGGRGAAAQPWPRPTERR